MSAPVKYRIEVYSNGRWIHVATVTRPQAFLAAWKGAGTRSLPAVALRVPSPGVQKKP